MSVPKGLVGLVTAALAWGLLVGAPPLASAVDASSVDGVNFKLRAITQLARVNDAAAGKDGHPSTVGPTHALPRGARTAPNPAGGTARSTAGQLASRAVEAPAAAAAVGCADMALAVTPMTDRIFLYWKDTGALSYTVWRKRLNGAWIKRATVTSTSYLDRGTNPDTFSTYRVVTFGGLSCDLTGWETIGGEDGWVTMGSADGWGAPDAIVGGFRMPEEGEPQARLLGQDTRSLGQDLRQGGNDPAFSPDGRLRASVGIDHGDLWGFYVTSMSGRFLGDGHLVQGGTPAGPAFSPDGRKVAYTVFAHVPAGSPPSPSLHVFDIPSWTDAVVPGSEGLIHPDWRSPTTLIAAGVGAAEGLYTIPAAGGIRTPVGATHHAGFPEVAPNGLVYYVEGEGTTFRLVQLSAVNERTVLRESTSTSFERPRVSPDGSLYYVETDAGDPAVPTDDTFYVALHDPAKPDEPFGTTLGAFADATFMGFSGYDVRQPKTKGTSDFAGDAGGDIVARDATGTLWVFPSSAESFVEPRIKVGPGWNIYLSFIAAGDLNGDDKADIIAKDGTGRLWFYAGRGNATFRARVLAGTGWTGVAYLAPGDVDGDGMADLVGFTRSGNLYLYAGKGTGVGFTKKLLGTGFSGMSNIIGVGDFNYDNTADLVSRERSTGRLILSAGIGAGRFAARKVVGWGWSSFTGFGTPEFDGFTGLYARTGTGALRYYSTIGDGRFAPGYDSVAGNWGSYTFSS